MDCIDDHYVNLEKILDPIIELHKETLEKETRADNYPMAVKCQGFCQPY